MSEPSPRPPARAWSLDDSRALVAETGLPLVHDPDVCSGVATDFGRLQSGDSFAVATPRSPAELAGILEFANARGLSLTPRGLGMSQGGQSIAAGGVTLDLSGMARVDAPDPASRTIRCEGGATWRALIAAAAPHGLLPKVVPLNLDLTIGGTLSVGGIGATSHQYGLALADVMALDVVTGGGRRVHCSEANEPAVFNAMLGGLGRSGIIAAATLELRPFKPFVRTFYLLYDAVGPWLSDQRALIASGRADYLEGFCTASVQGFRNGPRGRRPFAHWFYGLHITIEHEAGAAPEAGEALEGLRPFRVVHVEDAETVGFAARYEPRFEGMRRSGAWSQPHPWVEALLPGSAAEELVPRLLEDLSLTLGEVHRLFFVAKRNPRPLFMMPEAEEIVGFAVLPVGVAPHSLDDALNALRAVHARVVAAGGKRYPSGWLAMMNEDSWRSHFGERFTEWQTAKRELDPASILRSTLFP